MQKVPVTYADRRLIDPRNPSWQRDQFLSNNCAKLAAFLEGVPTDMHDQDSFTESYDEIPKHMLDTEAPIQIFKECGTTACAMGWAALSHIIPGLQYVIRTAGPDDSYTYVDYEPAINGRQVDWHEAAIAFFGPRAWHTIFHYFGSKHAVVRRLYAEAERLCCQAREKKAHG